MSYKYLLNKNKSIKKKYFAYILLIIKTKIFSCWCLCKYVEFKQFSSTCNKVLNMNQMKLCCIVFKKKALLLTEY